MSNLRVLVVGASIAGPTAAYWLARAGATVTVVERFPTLRRNGQSIDIRTAGVTVMRKMQGMETAVRAAAAPMKGWSIVNDAGRVLAVMRGSGDPDHQALLSEYEILRGDLSGILYDFTKDHQRVKYIFGDQVATMRQDAGEAPVKVDFANGTPTQEFDLIVACDGATSRTRAMGFECSVREHIHSMNFWAAYFSIPKDLLRGSDVGQSINRVPGLSVMVGPESSSSNSVLLFRNLSQTNDDATLPFRQASEQGAAELKRHVAAEFAGVGWKTNEIMQDMMGSENFYASEIVQVKIPSLSKNRLVLVGDAGYAAGPTGGGTSLAITGAYVLGGELSRCKGDLGAGLKAYEDRMRPIIDDLQKIPPGVLNFMAPQTAWGLWLRNWMFYLVSKAMILSGPFAWISSKYASSFGHDKYGIPDYEWLE